MMLLYSAMQERFGQRSWREERREEDTTKKQDVEENREADPSKSPRKVKNVWDRQAKVHGERQLEMIRNENALHLNAASPSSRTT
jgi:hypothetical protein